METKTVEQNDTKDPAVIDKLGRLGFKKASSKIKELSVKKQKMSIAYAMFKFVRPEKVRAFNDKLRAKTHNWDKMGGYHTLDFIGIGDYEGAPPDTVLEKLEKAQSLQAPSGAAVFDQYEIGYIKKVNDPLLFGRINGCPDRFFIDQWDDDVKIEDILG